MALQRFADRKSGHETVCWTPLILETVKARNVSLYSVGAEDCENVFESSLVSGICRMGRFLWYGESNGVLGASVA